MTERKVDQRKVDQVIVKVETRAKNGAVREVGEGLITVGSGCTAGSLTHSSGIHIPVSCAVASIGTTLISSDVNKVHTVDRREKPKTQADALRSKMLRKPSRVKTLEL